MRVDIYGSTSELGRSISEWLNDFDVEIRNFGRGQHPNGFDIAAIDSFSPGETSSTNVVVYLSWLGNPRSLDAQAKNIQALRAVLEAYPPETKVVFISSLASEGRPRSKYGLAKRLCETYIEARSDYLIVRPGTFYSTDKFAIGAMANTLNKLEKWLLGKPLFSPPRVETRRLARMVCELGIMGESQGTMKVQDHGSFSSKFEFVNLLVRLLSWPLALVNNDKVDRLLTYIDVKFPVT